MTETNAPVLCADIGGSNSRLALATRDATGLRLGTRQNYRNVEASGPDELIDRFLAGREPPSSACLAVAGPTDGNRVALTNLDWTIDADRLSRRFGFPVRLINDFAAVALGVDALDSDHLVTLQAGAPLARAPRLVLGPGTGLGVAHAIWRDGGYAPVPGEGGHIGFAPADDEQSALLNFLRGRLGRVSVERILSGPGICALHAFCLDRAGLAANPDCSPAVVTQNALDDREPAAREAMRLFIRILGQAAGDFALISGARGGAYLAGGIPPRILPLFEENGFLNGFHAKGRFSGDMQAIPVHVVTDPEIGLKGAALAAWRPFQ